MTLNSSPFTGSNAEQTRRHNRLVGLGQIRQAGRPGHAEMACASGLSVQAVSQRWHTLMKMILEQKDLQPEQLPGAGIVMPGPIIPTGLAKTSSVLAGWEGIEPVQLFFPRSLS